MLQDLDPNEVYREDYEEDLVQNQGLKTTGYDDNYSSNQYQDQTYQEKPYQDPQFKDQQYQDPQYQDQQYQAPYYNYQEDYFNEEDEYKYLEEEREEAESRENQRQQLHDQHPHDMGSYGLKQLDKLDEMEESEVLDDSTMGNKHDQDLDEMGGGYHSDEDAALDDNKLTNQTAMNKQNKKRHLTTQESISDSEFFSQRFDGPGLKSLNKQESIIEEEESTYPVVEETTYPKIMPTRVPTTREVGIVFKVLFIVPKFVSTH